MHEAMPSAAATGPLGPRLVIVVDGHATLAALRPGELLREAGFAVIGASSLDAMLELVAERGACCAVVDGSLDDRGGIEASRRLRERQGAAGVGIVCCDPCPARHAAALGAGADQFLLLPAEPVVFVAAVRAAAGRAIAAARGSTEEWLATVVHDLRGPLNSISSWAQLLRSGRLDSPAQEQALDAIVRGVRTQARMVDALQELARAGHPCGQGS